MDIRIGTAGYAYRHWVGEFYPPGTSSGGMLAYYATQFPVVEINASFHRVPTPEQVARWADRVPPGFAFTLKVPRSASHDGDLAELPAFRAAAGELARRGNLLGLVVQFAESFRNNLGNRAWLLRVREALADFPLAVEFRHRSWDKPGLPGWAERHRLTVVSISVPNLPTLFPAGPRIGGGRFYARLHSQNADAWYAGGAARYDYDYPEPVIRKWAASLRDAARQGVREAVFFFTNCVRVTAIANARTLAAVLRETAPEVNVIGPPEPARGRTLFDEIS
jgi:uncharacterized protein YecE (DUF72 family)